MTDYGIMKYIENLHIYNALDFKNYTSEKYNTNVKKNILCYVGAIKPTKSFHILAKNGTKLFKSLPAILEYPECIYDNKVYLICSKLKSKILYKIKN